MRWAFRSIGSGDSLDGSLARYRREERPRFGFLVDHTCDLFSQLLIIVAFGFSPYLSLVSALIVLLCYLLFSAYTYIRAATQHVHQMAYIGVGATEFELLMILWPIVAATLGLREPLVSSDLSKTDDVILVMAAMAVCGLFCKAVVDAAEIARIEGARWNAHLSTLQRSSKATPNRKPGRVPRDSKLWLVRCQAFARGVWRSFPTQPRTGASPRKALCHAIAGRNRRIHLQRTGIVDPAGERRNNRPSLAKRPAARPATGAVLLATLLCTGAFADARLPFARLGFCAQPAPPTCVDAWLKDGANLSACEQETERYVAMVFAYRKCLNLEMDRAVSSQSRDPTDAVRARPPLLRRRRPWRAEQRHRPSTGSARAR